jgi:hypothetical protein
VNLRIELKVAATVYVGDDVDPAGAKPNSDRKPNTHLMFTLVHANMLDCCTRRRKPPVTTSPPASNFDPAIPPVRKPKTQCPS